MSFTPAIPLDGLAGWRLLQRTAPRQRAAFDNSPQIRREVAHFTENAGKIQSLDQLMDDRTTLKVVLGAFGLDSELSKGAFVRKIIADGSQDRSAFANRLADPRFHDLAKAIGFGDPGGNRLGLASAREDIAARYKTLQFEESVGQSNKTMRLAMSFTREAPEIAAKTDADSNGWFSIMGNPALRQVVQTAFGMPDQTASIDIDKQKELFEEHAEQLLGSSSPAVFQDPEAVDTLIRRFLLRTQINQGPSAATPGMAALSLLTGGGLSGGGLSGGGLSGSGRANLIVSLF